MAKKGDTSGKAAGDSPLQILQQITGSASGLDIAMLDGQVLWLVAMALAECGASISLGVTQAGDSWSLQLWDGKFPTKTYHRTTEDLNRQLSAVLWAYRQRERSELEDKVIRSYGWVP